MSFVGLPVAVHGSETFLEYLDDIPGAPHCIEMHSGDIVPEQVLALHYAPFCPYPLYCLPVIAGGLDGIGKFHRYVEGE